MDGTILGQGTFQANFVGLANPNPGVASRSNANAVIIQIPSGADFVSVYNYTQYGTVGAAGTAYFNGAATATIGADFYWQRGMAAGTGIVRYKGAATAVLDGDTLVSGGFTLYDPSAQTAGAQPLLGPPVATTATTNATRPVVSTANTAGISVGTVVRLSNTAQNDINGVDFVVGAVVANTSFTLTGNAQSALANAPGAIGGAGFYRIVNDGNTGLFYPRRRNITNITQALNPVVSTAKAHGLTPGQEIRFNIPAVSGMTQLNPSALNSYYPSGTTTPAIVLTVIDDYNFTINIDTTTYTAFTYPTIAQQPSSFPIFIPMGEDTATSLITPLNQVPTIGGQQIFNTQTGLLADATVNTGFLGMILGTGGNGLELTTPILGPSGSITWSAGNVATPDTLYWVAGKSTYGGL